MMFLSVSTLPKKCGGKGCDMPRPKSLLGFRLSILYLNQLKNHSAFMMSASTPIRPYEVLYSSYNIPRMRID